jgi:hypothetical protein
MTEENELYIEQPERPNDGRVSSTDAGPGSREINPKFKDLKETGKWGNISKKEMIIVAVVMLSIVVAVVVVVVVFVTGDDDSIPIAGGIAPTSAPTMRLVPQEQLDLLRQGIGLNPLTASFLDLLPTNAEALRGLSNVLDEDPVRRAASWVVHEDQLDAEPELLNRFGLVATYYSNGGSQWTNSDNWLDPDLSICDGWYGVSCDLLRRDLDEIDLANNNLTGPITKSLSLLSTLRVIWFNGNALTGTIPGDVFSSLEDLFILYLQNNQLEGDIPENLIENGVLQTIFLQGNNFTGTWPAAFCGVLREFRLECEQTPCPERCCVPLNNCFD